VTINVSLNGVDLEEGRDFKVLPDRIMLRRPKPKARPRTFLEKCELLLRGRWKDLFSPHEPYPDFVIIEHWLAGWRDTFFFGTKEFDRNLVYEEDVQE
jgi:hypothetical protein